MDNLVFDIDRMKSILLNLEKPCFAISNGNRIGLTNDDSIAKGQEGFKFIAYSAPVDIAMLGDNNFLKCYNLKYPYMVGAMSGGISSIKMTVELGRAGFLCSFGSSGMLPKNIEDAIIKIKSELPVGQFAFNLIHSPTEPLIEEKTVELFLKHDVRIVEASAFMKLTSFIAWYRASGLKLADDGSIIIKNRIIAKISRNETAEMFMRPLSSQLLQPLVEKGLITHAQAEMAQRVPVADDITAEADSGGHTDNRPFICLIPSILALRDRIQQEYRYKNSLRIGAGGGVSTPLAALASFMMGASYIVSGSIHHASVEAGTSEHTKKLLSQADMADVMMSPCADMFEIGAKVQVLKKGTMFPMRAQKLYQLYTSCSSLEAIPVDEKEKIEKQIFQRPLSAVWEDTVKFFGQREPSQIEQANKNPKKKMALIFRWYIGLASRWSANGEKGREIDYQIWCGPAMGAFNSWVKNSYLEKLENRKSVDMAKHILTGAGYLYRLQNLKMQGLELPAELGSYNPQPGYIAQL